MNAAQSRTLPHVDQTAQGFYSDALIYDILHAQGTAEDVNLLVRLLKRLNRWPASPRVFEPACGTGRYLRALSRSGARTIGLDLSEPMIEFARSRARSGARGPAPRFIVGDMTRLEDHLRPRSLDAAFCLINSIRHVPSDAAMVRHLTGVRVALKPRGAYVVGISMSAPGMEFPSEDVWTGRRGAIHVQQNISYVPPTTPRDRWEQVHSHLTITRGRAEPEHRDSRYRLRCYTTTQWEQVIARAGLEVLATTDQHGRPSGRPLLGYHLWVLSPSRAG